MFFNSTEMSLDPGYIARGVRNGVLYDSACRWTPKELMILERFIMTGQKTEEFKNIFPLLLLEFNESFLRITRQPLHIDVHVVNDPTLQCVFRFYVLCELDNSKYLNKKAVKSMRSVLNLEYKKSVRNMDLEYLNFFTKQDVIWFFCGLLKSLTLCQFIYSLLQLCLISMDPADVFQQIGMAVLAFALVWAMFAPYKDQISTTYDKLFIVSSFENWKKHKKLADYVNYSDCLDNANSLHYSNNSSDETEKTTPEFSATDLISETCSNRLGTL